MASASLTAIHSKKEFRLAPQPLRFLLLRRLRLPLPLSARSCRCGRPLDVLGHHRAACGTAGVLARRGWVLENVAARVCREAGGSVRVNVLVRDMDLHEFNQLDGRRLEVVVGGLPLWNGAQLAIDTTMVSPVRSEGTARAGTASINGKASDVARARKARRYPELSGEHGWARLLVLGTEVGGRWSTEAATFLCSPNCDEKAANCRGRGRRRTGSDDVEKRALSAELLLQVGDYQLQDRLWKAQLLPLAPKQLWMP